MQDYQKTWHAKQWAENAAYRKQMRRDWLRNKYGLTLEEYEAVLESQGGRCAICQTTDWGKAHGKPIKNPAVDHDHLTGKIRGILCDKCNRGLGYFQDDPALLIAAVAYLKEKPGAKGEQRLPHPAVIPRDPIGEA